MKSNIKPSYQLPAALTRTAMQASIQLSFLIIKGFSALHTSCFGSLCTTLLLNHPAALERDKSGALNFFHEFNSWGDLAPHRFQQGTSVSPQEGSHLPQTKQPQVQPFSSLNQKALTKTMGQEKRASAVTCSCQRFHLKAKNQEAWSWEHMGCWPPFTKCSLRK